jgi:hypothetical protein
MNCEEVMCSMSYDEGKFPVINHTVTLIEFLQNMYMKQYFVPLQINHTITCIYFIS